MRDSYTWDEVIARLENTDICELQISGSWTAHVRVSRGDHYGDPDWAALTK